MIFTTDIANWFKVITHPLLKALFIFSMSQKGLNGKYLFSEKCAWSDTNLTHASQTSFKVTEHPLTIDTL